MMGNQKVTLIVGCFFVQTIILLIAFHPNTTRKFYNTMDTNMFILENDSARSKSANLLSLYEIGMKYKTDKVITHHYETLYEKYLSRYRNTPIRVLEIGLGCRMNPEGASAETWREYFGPRADLHMIEFDPVCGKKWENAIGRQVKIDTLSDRNRKAKDFFRSSYAFLRMDTRVKIFYDTVKRATRCENDRTSYLALSHAAQL